MRRFDNQTVTRIWVGVFIALGVALVAAFFMPQAAPQVTQSMYRYHGTVQLNNLTLTPGAVGPMTAQQLCSKSFHTGSVRNVDESTKKKVCAEYGVAPEQCNGRQLEIDHLVSLELGGTNDIKNLWPQFYSPRPGAHEKDVVENWLHSEVCHNLMSLPDAQKMIVQDWYDVYTMIQAKK